MADLKENSWSIRRGLPALVLVAVFGLSACGGSDGDNSAEGAGVPTTDAAESSDVDDTSSSDGKADAPDPVAVLPFEVDVPSGHRMLDARCEIDESDPNAEEPKYSTWITYAVPDSWVASGRGSAGSGGVTGTDEDLTFRVDDGNGAKGKINIGVSWDRRGFDGRITDANGDPWESFDYDSSVGDDKTTIKFDKVATVEVGDQDADLFYMDPSQAPKHVSSAEYRIRMDAFKLPRTQPDGGYELVPESFVVTLRFDPEDTAFDQNVIETLVKTFVLPECSWEDVLLDQELLLNLDLNGDGHVRDSDDVQKELKELQERMKDDLGARRQDADPAG